MTITKFDMFTWIMLYIVFTYTLFLGAHKYNDQETVMLLQRYGWS